MRWGASTVPSARRWLVCELGRIEQACALRVLEVGVGPAARRALTVLRQYRLVRPAFTTARLHHRRRVIRRHDGAQLVLFLVEAHAVTGLEGRARLDLPTVDERAVDGPEIFDPDPVLRHEELRVSA
jgi:hypothetical protein